MWHHSIAGAHHEEEEKEEEYAKIVTQYSVVNAVHVYPTTRHLQHQSVVDYWPTQFIVPNNLL